MMKMEKVSKTRWAMLVFLGVILFVVLSGCAMFEEQMNTMKGLVGFAPDKEIILCEGTECVETPVASEDVKG